MILILERTLFVNLKKDKYSMYTRDEVYAHSLDYFSNDELAAEVFVDKYALRNQHGEYFERTPEDMHKRLATEFSRIEQKYINPLSYEEILNYFREWEIVPQGSILNIVGNPFVQGSPANCSVVPSPVDSYSGILYTDTQLASLFKRRYGVGVSLDNIRPANSPVNNPALTSTGVVSFAQRYSNTTREVGQNGRRGALMLTLSVYHPDIIEFIKAKVNLEKITGANISVKLYDSFMRAVEKDENITLHWPLGDVDKAQIVKQVRAVDIWNLFIESNITSAEPGALFWDTITKYSLSNCYVPDECVNPCQPGFAPVLTPDGIKTLDSCDIGSVIWSTEGWTTIVNKWSNGVKKVYKYTTNSGSFIGTENHLIIENDKKIEVKNAKKLNTLKGPIFWTSEQDVIDFFCEGEHTKFFYSRDFFELCPDTLGIQLNNSLEYIIYFLKLLYDDHGDVSKEGVSLYSKHVLFLERIQLLLNSVGVSSVLEESYPLSEWYVLSIFEDASVFEKCIGFYKEDKQHQLEKFLLNAVYSGIECDSPITKIKYLGEFEVFDITVSNSTHTYWTGGINVSNCSELSLPSYETCRLITVNPFKFVQNPFTENANFEFERFGECVYVAQRLMDDVVDLDIECLERIKEKIENDPEEWSIKQIEYDTILKFIDTARKYRRTGLGTLALADVFASMGMGYASEESIQLSDAIMRVKMENEFASSIDMALERGPFEGFDSSLEVTSPLFQFFKEKFPDLAQRMENYGRRNISISTIAPTGSIAIEAQVSAGMDPVYYLEFIRRKKLMGGNKSEADYIDIVGDCWTEHTIVHPPYAYMCNLEQQGVQTFLKNPYNGNTAHDIDPFQKLKLHAVLQKYITHSISNTYNLPENTSVETVSRLYFKAWGMGIKGITVYVEGSRSGVLVSNATYNKQKGIPLKRPEVLPCDIHEFLLHTENDTFEKWLAFVGMCNRSPYELFIGKLDNMNLPEGILSSQIRKIKLNNVNSYVLECQLLNEKKYVYGDLSRLFNREFWNYAKLVSGLLRHNMPLQYIIHTIENMKFDTVSLHTWQAGIVRVLKSYIPDGVVSKNTCATCGNQLIFIDGCLSCTCGYSKCS